jgi:hypothetical protein
MRSSSSGAEACFCEDALELADIGLCQRLIAMELQDSDVALVCLEELPHLGAEAVHIGACRNAGHIDRGLLPYLILEVAIDDRTALQLDQLDKRAKPAAHGL